MAQQIVFFEDTNENAATTIAGMRADYEKYGINCALGINISGVSTFTGAITDNNEQVGAAGSVLSSTGSGVRWIPAGEGNTASASNVGINEDSTDAEQWLTFVGAKSSNNPIRVDDDLRYNPSTNTLTAGNLISTSKVGIGSTQPDKELDLLDETNQVDIRLKTTANSFNSFIFDSNRGKELQYALIDGDWDGTTVNRIRFVTGSNDTDKDDGWMAFHTKETGQTLAERLRITQYGVNVTGICSATSFKGPADGTAAVYYGDGSNLTGIENYSVFTGATAGTPDTAGTSGLVPQPAAGDHDKFLKADGNWTVPSYVTYSVFGGTSAGLVPASTAEQTDKFLRSDGSWTNSQVKSNWNETTTTNLSFIENKPDVLKFKSFKIRVTSVTPGVEGTDFDTITAATTTDTFEIVKGANVTLTADTSNKKLTIAAANDNTTYSIATSDNGDDVDINLNNGTSDDTITVTKGDNITLTHEANGNGFTIAASDTTYDAPSTSVPGLVPVLPVDGSSNPITTQFLRSDGSWANDNDTWRAIDDTPADGVTTESISSNWAFDHAAAEGNSAHVPAAGTDNSGTFLANNGTWQTPNYTTNTNTTYTLPASGTDSTDFGNGSAIITLTDNASTPNTDAVTITAGSNIKLTSIAEGGFTISAQDTTASVFTAATANAAGSTGVVPQPAAGDHVKFLRGDATWTDISATTITLADESGSSADTTCFLVFSKDATGTEKSLHTNSGIGIDAKEKTITASKFIVDGATSGLLKYDGTLDTNTYLQSGEAGTTYTFGVEAPTNAATDRENIKITAGGAGSGNQFIGFLAGSGLSIDLNSTDKTITYAGVDFTGATSSAAGTAGLVIQPAAGDQTKFLKGDGTWATPTDTTTNNLYKLECLQTGSPLGNPDPKLSLKTNGGSGSTYTEVDSVQINGGTNCSVTRGGDGSLTIDATETSHSDVVVDGDFTSNGFMKTDGSGTYSVDANTYLTSETSHSDVLVDGDFGSQGFMKRGATAGSYSVDTNSYSTTSHTHSYQDPLTFSTGISESSDTVTVDAAVVTSVTVSTTNATTVDTIALSSFRVAEYTIHIAHSSGIQAQKLLVMCNGTSGSDHHSEYGIMYSTSLLGTFSTTTSGSNVLVQFNSVNTSTTVKFIKQIVV